MCVSVYVLYVIGMCICGCVVSMGLWESFPGLDLGSVSPLAEGCVCVCVCVYVT